MKTRRLAQRLGSWLLLTFIAIGLPWLTPTSAQAIPLLQIYVEGGTYDASDDTWRITTGSGVLWVMAHTTASQLTDGTIHNAILTATTLMGGSQPTITPIARTSTSTAEGGVPDPSTAPAVTFKESGTGAHPVLPPHGIFAGTNTWTDYWMGTGASIDVGTGTLLTGTAKMSLTDSPVADLITSFPPYTSGSTTDAWTDNAGQINAYSITAASGTKVHFDGYGYYLDTPTHLTFAPFSHDAEINGEFPRVPEPSALVLLGSGLVGLVAWRRKRAE